MIFISISEEAKQKRYESYRNKRKEKAQNYIGKKYNHWTIIKYNETITENNYMVGKTGVSFNEEKGLWTSYITVNYKRTWLGDYDNIDDAIKARKETEEKYNFTCDDIVAPYDEEAF